MCSVFAIDCFIANEGAAFLQPIVSDRAEAFGALAAEVVSGVGDVEVSISGEGDVTGFSCFSEGSDRKGAGLVGLWAFVLVPFDFLCPVVVVSEVPSCDWFVVEEFDFNCVGRITSPEGRFLCR